MTPNICPYCGEAPCAPEQPACGLDGPYYSVECLTKGCPAAQGVGASRAEAVREWNKRKPMLLGKWYICPSRIESCEDPIWSVQYQGTPSKAEDS